jgi:heme-degrading monooxygenase HmoA
MVCRVATFDKKPEVNAETLRAFRAWMKEQPGFRAAYHVQEPQTGRALSISLWETMEHLLAMKDRTFPGGALGLKPDRVEIFPMVEEF